MHVARIVGVAMLVQSAWLTRTNTLVCVECFVVEYCCSLSLWCVGSGDFEDVEVVMCF